jgi:hypothetical protein
MERFDGGVNAVAAAGCLLTGTTGLPSSQGPPAGYQSSSSSSLTQLSCSGKHTLRHSNEAEEWKKSDSDTCDTALDKCMTPPLHSGIRIQEKNHIALAISIGFVHNGC